MRCIKIENCSECPNIGHKGGWGTISYIPICRKDNKELPYTVKAYQTMICASVNDGVPDWCPLDEFKENK